MKQKRRELRAKHGKNCTQNVSPCSACPSFQTCFIFISFLFRFYFVCFVLFCFDRFGHYGHFGCFGRFSLFSWYSWLSRFEDVLISFQYPTWMREHILELHQNHTYLLGVVCRLSCRVSCVSNLKDGIFSKRFELEG